MPWSAKIGEFDYIFFVSAVEKYYPGHKRPGIPIPEALIEAPYAHTEALYSSQFLKMDGRRLVSRLLVSGQSKNGNFVSLSVAQLVDCS